MSAKVESKASRGIAGGVYITDTAAHPGDFNYIKALGATVIATLVSSNLTGTLTAIPLASGEFIEGRFSSITLTSGKVIAYNNRYFPRFRSRGEPASTGTNYRPPRPSPERAVSVKPHRSHPSYKSYLTQSLPYGFRKRQ